MARLPVPGSDDGVWGTVLNEYLGVAHEGDGTLKSGISADKIVSGTTNKTFTDAEKNKLASLATVASSGSYTDLSDKPTIPSQYTDEQAQDAAAAMLTGGTHAGVAFQYNDASNNMNVTVANATLVIAADAPASWRECAGVLLDGSDDSAALSTAINNGPVILSPGTFTLTSPLSVTAENPNVIGYGWSSILKVANGMNNWAMIFTPGGNGIRGRFANFTIDGNSTNQTAGGGIHARGAVQSEFHFIHFLNCYTAGLWLDAFPDAAFGHHNKVVSCLFDATVASPGNGHGLLINSNDENYVRSEFQFLGGTGTPTYAIRDLTGLNTFQSCVFVGGRNNMGGVELRDGQRSRVLNCSFDGVSGTNVFVASSSAHIINDNIFTSVADQTSTNGVYSGIHLEFAVKECIVTGNVLETSSTANRTRSLIREDGSGGTGVNIFKDNVLRQTGTGTPSVGFTEMGGTGSRVADNAVNGTIVL